MTNLTSSMCVGDFPSRIVSFCLGVVSVAFAAVLRNRHDHDTFRVPLALTIASTVWFLASLATTGYVLFRGLPFCPRRATSLIVFGTAAIGCCAATAALASGYDAVHGQQRGFRLALIGMQISCAVLETYVVAYVGYEWGLNRNRSRSARAARDKNSVGSV